MWESGVEGEMLCTDYNRFLSAQFRVKGRPIQSAHAARLAVSIRSGLDPNQRCQGSRRPGRHAWLAACLAG